MGEIHPIFGLFSIGQDHVLQLTWAKERNAEPEGSPSAGGSAAGSLVPFFIGLFDFLNKLDLYTRALSTNLIQTDVEQIVPLTLARAGFEKRLIESGKSGGCHSVVDEW